MHSRPFFAAGLALLASFAWTQDIQAQLRRLPGVVDVRLSDGRESASGSYEITFEQPLDTNKPKGPKFQQRVVLHHARFDAPVLLLTEGYWVMRGEGAELRRMLQNPNFITVEHRFFGQSIPNPARWESLTVKNAADDMHRIVTALKQLYKGKWISTGVSKSGQTSLFYKCFYPNDVDATVAYSAPVNVTQEDPRISMFMETVGEPEIRARLKAFQIALLKREDELVPLLKADPKEYSMGVPQAYEYGIFEVPYSYWQLGFKPADIPEPDAPAAEILRGYNRIGGLSYYSDAGRKQFQAFMYQAFTEIGYYNYDISDLKPYLKAVKSPTNLVLTPPEARAKIVYNPATMAFVFPHLQYKADHVIYLYGETDAWAATQMRLLGRTDSLKIVVKGAAHNVQITSGSPEQKAAFYDAMDRWLGMKLVRI